MRMPLLLATPLQLLAALLAFASGSHVHAATKEVEAAVAAHQAFVDTTAVVHRTLASYVSFNVDFSNRPYQPQANIFNANLRDLQLRTLVSALSPAVLRLGGGAADATAYAVAGHANPAPQCTADDAGLLPWNATTGLYECVKPRRGFPSMKPPAIGCHWPCAVLSTDRLAEWVEFAEATNVSLSFDLSPGNPYNFSHGNVEALVRYARQQNWRIFSFEFGNELSSLRHNMSGVETSCGKAFADTFIWLHDLIVELWTDSELPQPLLIGPSSDSSGQPAFAQDFFRQLHARGRLHVLDAFVYHAYGGQQSCPACIGHPWWTEACCEKNYQQPACNATTPASCDPATQCFVYSAINPVPPASIVACMCASLRNASHLDRNYGAANNFEKVWGAVLSNVSFAGQVWIGESAAHAGGGLPQVTNAFVSGFYYLDTLANLAQAGHSVFLRQGLMGGWYSLLQPTPLSATTQYVSDFVPLPDFWAGLLFKRTMGVEVLRAGPHTASASEMLRMYAHCATAAAAGEEDGVARTGAITLLLLNLGHAPLSIGHIRGLGSRSNLSPRLEWHLTPGNGTGAAAAMSSSEVWLNDKKLELTQDGMMPALEPRKVGAGGGPLVVAPASFAFVTLLAANASACA